MFNKRRNYLAVNLILLVSFTSCVNLQHVNKFATTSVEALARQDDIGYSFTQHCLDFECKKDIYHIPDVTKDFGKAAPCNCDTFKKADDALDLFNSVLTAYLTGLANLSDSKAVNYNFDNLIKAVDVDEIAGQLKITKPEMTSLGNLATIISNDLMNLYRKRKLKEIIKKSNTDFGIVISAYRKCVNDFFKNVLLDNDLNITLPNLYSTYFITNAALLSPLEKARIYEEYLARRATFETYKALTARLVFALDEIKDGHNKLNEESDHLTRNDLKQLINEYSTDIRAALGEFRKLKKSNQN
ncbi:MAG: hypothetical protein ABI863_22445 [Ginsengibacter sp.]